MKHLIKEEGEYTPEATVLINDVIDTATVWFQTFMDRGFNSFEILGIITSAIVNAQRQAWLNIQEEKEGKAS